MRRLYALLAYGLQTLAWPCEWYSNGWQSDKLGQAILLVPSSPSKSTSLTYPVALEAILPAEIGLLSELLACRALQAAGIFVAVCTLALALLVDRHLRRRRLVHDDGVL